MKKVIAILICVAMLSALSCLCASGSANYSIYQYGDANLDGTPDLIDVTVLQRYIANQDVVKKIAQKQAAVSLEKQGITVDSPCYDKYYRQYTENLRLIILEAADYDHSGLADILDATAEQRSLIGLALPESYGGTFSNECKIENYYASFASGKAMVGEPVTFTSLVTSSTAIVDYTFFINGVEVQRSPDNTLTYTFDEKGNYRIESEVRNVIGCTRHCLINYRVTEPYDIVTKPVIINYYYDSIHPTSGYMLTVGAAGGTAPYNYTFRINLNGREKPVQYADLKDFRYAAETLSDGTITATYIIQDKQGTNVAYLPNDLFNEYHYYGGINETVNQFNKYEIIVQATDASGVQSEPVAIPYEYTKYFW